MLCIIWDSVKFFYKYLKNLFKFFFYSKVKKEAESREREVRLADGEKEVVQHSRSIEASQFEKLLNEKNLKIVEVKKVLLKGFEFILFSM